MDKLTDTFVPSRPRDDGAWYCDDCGTNLVSDLHAYCGDHSRMFALCQRTDTVVSVTWHRHLP